MMTRGPKKGKQEAVPTSDDLINIFKDRNDPEIKDIDEYPVWLLEMALPMLDPLVAGIAMGAKDDGMSPEAHNIPHLERTARRYLVQQQNILRMWKEAKDRDDLYPLISLGNTMQFRSEELEAQEAAKTAEAEAAEEEEDEDEEGGAKKQKGVVVDREKERKEEEEFKAKLYGKAKTK